MTKTPHSVHTGRPRPRSERRMWRVSQCAHRFVDRRKQAAREAARGRTVRDGER